MNHEQVNFNNRTRVSVVGRKLLSTTVAVYCSVRDHEFMCYEEQAYTSENQQSIAGIALERIVCALGLPRATQMITSSNFR